MSEIGYHLPGIHCQGCEAAIRRALQRIEGVETVSVDLDHKRVRVRYDEQRATPDAIREAIERAGFEVG